MVIPFDGAQAAIAFAHSDGARRNAAVNAVVPAIIHALTLASAGMTENR